MTRTLSACCFVTILLVAGCSPQRAEPSLQQSAEDTLIVGKVIDLHVLGTKKEQVTICSIDPRFVVCLETDEGARNLAIHSPAMTFAGKDPTGVKYRFHLKKTNGGFLLVNAEEILP